MKLQEFIKKPLMEALEELDIVDTRIHTDDEGNVCSVELKYSTKKPEEKAPQKGRGLGW